MGLAWLKTILLFHTFLALSFCAEKNKVSLLLFSQKREENGNATWCTITRVVLVGTPVGCLLAYNSG